MRIMIGYLAQVSRNEVLCEGDACVVVGSRQRLKAYLGGKADELDELRPGYALKKVWLEDILAGIMHGGAYAFDEEAYKLFYPHAQRAGFSIGEEDFNTAPATEIEGGWMHLVRVQMVLPR